MDDGNGKRLATYELRYFEKSFSHSKFGWLILLDRQKWK